MRTIIPDVDRVPTTANSARAVVALIAIAGALAGCGTMPTQRLGAMTPVSDAVKKIKPPDVSAHSEQAVSYVDVGDQGEFVLRPMGGGEQIPAASVRPFVFDGVAVYDVIRTLIDQSGLKIGLTMDLAETSARRLRRTTVSYKASGTLAEAIEGLSRSAGFFYRYQGGVLRVSSDEQFIVTLPPVPESFEGVPQMVAKLGAKDVLLERSARTLTFRADQQSFEKVRTYLDMLRRSKSLLFYDCYIWEVQLNDSSRLGIRWQQLGSALNSAGSGAASVGGAALAFTQDGSPGSISLSQGSIGTALGFSFKASKFSMSMFLDFLQTQGTINNISQPKLSMLSGGTSQFRNGMTQPYISKITGGIAVNGAVTGGGTETSTAQTGLTLTITGDHADGTIYSDLSLVIKDITRFDTFTVPTGNSSTGSLSLPVIAEREVHARVRSRPGEAIVVGGINTQNVSNVAKGVGPVKTDSDKSGSQSELVIVLVPKVTLFRSAEQVAPQKTTEN